MKTPINGAKLSSNFGYRKHPILGYTKLHRGVDFAAPRGTPIFASGSGRIEYIGRKGGYGNYIKIRHNASYSTAYGHMSRFAKNKKRWQFVKQGEIIGYVGTTGRSTGNHLHYEIIKNGVQINPRTIKFKSTTVLSKNDLVEFYNNMQNFKNSLKFDDLNKVNEYKQNDYKQDLQNKSIEEVFDIDRSFVEETAISISGISNFTNKSVN
jgi:hypothetical protein